MVADAFGSDGATRPWSRLARGPDYQHGSPLVVVGIALLVFPKLALGLSGFETGVAVMPHIHGDPDDTPAQPAGRIRGAQRLLTTAAVIMSVFLITSSLVTTLLIPAGGVPARRRGQRPGTGLPGARVPGQRVRQRLRRVDDRDLVVRRRVGDGRAAEPDPALPAPLRDGPAVGPGRPSAGAGLHPGRVPDHAHLPTPTSTPRAARTPPACWS